MIVYLSCKIITRGESEDIMQDVIEMEHLTPENLKAEKEMKMFASIVKSYNPAYFNIADVPLLEIYVRTYQEIVTLYDVMALSGSVADEGNKKYEKVSRLISAKVKQLIQLGASLRINPQQRRAAGTTRQDNPEDSGRIPKSSSRDEITDQKVWE